MSNYAPTQKDVDSMKALQGIINGDIPQTPVQNSTPSDSKTMKEILERFHGAGGDSLAEEMSRETLSERYVQSGNESLRHEPITEEVHVPSNYQVSMELVESEGKNKKRYFVLSESKEHMVDALTFKESASAIQKYLSKGYKVHGDKVQTIIGLEEDYDRFKLEAAKNKKHYDRCLELDEFDASEVFRKRIKAARAEAIAVKESIRSIEETIR